MRTMRLCSAALIAALAAGAVATPVFGATRADRKQNKSIRTLDKRSKAAARQLKSLNSDATTQKAGLAALQNTVGSLNSEATTQKAGLAALQNTVDSMRAAVDFATAGVEQADAGLAGLRSTLTGYAAATEYGVAQLYFDPEGDGFEANDAVPGQIVTSADVPDDTNQSTVTGRLLLKVPDATTAKPIALKAAMRSGEKDGTGASNPVGAAGLMAMTASNIGAAGSTSVGGGNPGTTALPLSSAPNGALGGLPVYPIPDKAPREGPNPLVFPDGQSIELTNPATLQNFTGAPSRFTVTNTSGADSAAIFDVTVRFHDLSASTTDLEE
jgi:hypothetical protein